MPKSILHALSILATLSSVSLAQRPERVNQLLAAAELPVSAAQARREGTPNGEVRSVLDAMRASRVPAHEARLVIDEGRSARRTHGPVDNFGAFVQSKLRAGLRGRDLAAAIRAEHAARGKNRGARATAPGTRAKAGTPAGAKAGTPTKTKAGTTKTKSGAQTKGAAKQSEGKQKAVDSPARSKKNAKQAAPATKAPATKARPTGRTVKPTE